MNQAIGYGVGLIMCASVAIAADVTPQKVAFSDGAVSDALTGSAGDAVNGRKVFANRKQGNCLACHMNADLDEQSFHGEVGPPLDGVADRWTAAELRGIVSNAKMMFEDTIMPAFYIDAGYTRPLEKFEGKSILTAQQVEDVVAYLLTLKEE
ncbi:sulfur oxidation c-type cytochrome SoxX [Cognatishimia sp. D5M38]|jgi:sulfur-oxidizing protein SoxX|uniref:Sulfur oxidation c-type cytochrome SoxX n=1 Tax=Cognatishimia coralii TaxID=3083254 RepID=A0ABU8QIN8_9RHOB